MVLEGTVLRLAGEWAVWFAPTEIKFKHADGFMKRIGSLLCLIALVAIGVVCSRIYFSAPNLTDLAKIPRHPSSSYVGDKQIAVALKYAKQQGKLVLVQSSSQGCTWCHVLNRLLTTDTELVEEIKNNFVYVLVDTTNDGERLFYKKYAENTEHTLVLLALDNEGKQTARKVGEEFLEVEPDHPNNYRINPKMILEFLKNQHRNK